MSDRRKLLWTFVVTSAAAFMVSLDNLVVTTALPSIRAHLHAGLEGLEWTVNAYTLTFAVFLLTGAALGDRFGRRRIFALGIGIFTLASATAAMSSGVGMLIAARAVQGVGAAMVLPLSLTILSHAVPAERRGAALGIWGGVSGLGVAVGPLVGGAVTQGAAWQWIFWLNVPVGLAVLPLVLTRLPESYGPSKRLDMPGLVLASGGFLGVVLGLVRGNAHGWTSLGVDASLAVGAVLLAAFVAWERRSPQPLLPLHYFRNRTFSAVNGAALLFSFGMFGSIFLLAQFLQVVQGYSPLGAGLRTLPWTMMPLIVAPLAGPLSDRLGGRPLLITGLVLQAAGLGWIGLVLSTTVSYPTLVPAFVLAGIGMALFFVPVANVVMGSVPAAEEGVASGANNSIRELGGVFGVAVLSSVFSAHGGYASRAAFVHGTRPAIFVGVFVVLAGAAVAALIPTRRAARTVSTETVGQPAEPAGEQPQLVSVPGQQRPVGSPVG